MLTQWVTFTKVKAGSDRTVKHMHLFI